MIGWFGIRGIGSVFYLLRLATFRRKNAIFELLRGEQKMNKAAVVGGLGFSTRGRKRGIASALG